MEEGIDPNIQENKLIGCYKCKRTTDHEPTMFGQWACIVCGDTKE